MIKPTFDKLYLAKDGKDSKGDIYINKCPQVQHQLDGIRFIYRAFIKKKHGIIINDPSGYGKRVQTALFLSAVLPKLGKHVLILCREGKEQLWIRHFQEWTQLSDDVAIELSNPFAKKKVLISACYAAGAFARRDWSVLVVDDELISKDIQKSSLRADFKIWITSSAIKDDLCKFSSFYSWVYPKDKLDANKYKANTRDLRDVLMKTAMLEAFLENTVLRRDCGVTPFAKTQNYISNNITESRVTKKNKDATGTKIKRSKRKSTDTKSTGTTKDIANKVANTKEKDTEEFKIGDLGNGKPIKVARTTKKITESVAKDFDISDNRQNDENSIATSRSRKKSRKFKVLWNSEDSDNEQVDKKGDNENNNSLFDESEEQSKALRWDTDTDSENDHESSVLRLHANKEQIMSCKLNHDEIKLVEVDNAKNDLDNSLIINEQNPMKLLSEIDIDNETNKIYPVVNNSNKFSEDLFSTDFTTKPNEVNVKVTELVETKSTVEMLPTGSNDSNVEESNDESTKIVRQEEINEKAEQKVAENANLSIFEIKMKEMEELMLKKYKGSLLDSIF